jgi:2-phospho-L-lactate guanylyltransferase
MKPLAQAKTRLSGQLTQAHRVALSRNLLRRVLKALAGPVPGLAEASALEGVWVVGGDAEVEQVAWEEGADWYPEEGSDVNESLERAFRRALASGRAALFVPGDLPFLKPRDVHAFVVSAGHLKNVTLAPARYGGGTNGILVVPGLSRSFQPMLGPESFKRHLSQASSSGISVAIYYSAGLALDLDTLEDLRSYEYMEPGLLQKLIGEEG